MRGPGDRLLLADGFQRAYVRNLSRAYVNLGRRVTVIGGDMHSELVDENGVRFLNLRGDDSPGRSIPRKVVDLLRFEIHTLIQVVRSPSRYVYHLGIGKFWIDRVFANAAYLLLGKRTIHTVHDLLPHDRVTLLNRLEHFLIYRLTAHHLVVHTEYLKRGLTEQFGVAPERITVAPHGTYDPPTTPGLDRDEARRQLDIPHDATVVLCFGWQRPYKGTHTLLEALADDWPEGLTVVIRGVTHPSYARELDQIVESRGLEGRVRAQYGYADDQTMELLFKASSIVALPYTEGSQSGVLFMSYAYGRPVIASDVGGFPEYVVPGLTGEVFPQGDRDALRRTLAAMASEIEKYDPEAIAAYANRHHSWSRCAETVDSVMRPARSSDSGAAARARPHRGTPASHRKRGTTDRSYVIITAARNEAQHIGRTIDSVASQTVTPRHWVVVDDGSTDDTGRLLAASESSTDYVEILTRGHGQGRSFGSKVAALAAAYDRVRSRRFSYVAVLDADIELPPDYYESIMSEFERDERLGSAGGWIMEPDETGRFAPAPGNRVTSIAGAVQVFRRECFDEIGGIPDMPLGNEDTVACSLAEMRGWKTRSLRGCEVLHLKPRSHAGPIASLRATVREGMSEYEAGYHPAYLLAKAVRRTFDRPVVLASLARVAGFFARAVSTRRRVLPDDVISFVRRRQLVRLLSPFCGRRDGGTAEA